MQRIIKENKVYSDSEEEEKDDEDMEDIEEDEEGEDEEDEDMNSGSSDEEEETKKGKSGKQTLKARIKEEQEIRKKEKNMRNNTDQPKNVDDFERMVVANSDQSFVWI